MQLPWYNFVGATISTSAPDAAATWGTSDAGSYLSAGISIHKTGGLEPGWQWVGNLWAPGMPRLLSWILVFTGLQKPFIPYLALLSALLWAAVGASFFVWLRKRHSSALAVGLVVVPFFFPQYYRYLLVDRIIWSDGYALAAALLALSLALNATASRSRVGQICLVLGAALSLAAACYVRHQWFLMIYLVVGISALRVIITTVQQLCRRFRSTVDAKQNDWEGSKKTLVLISTGVLAFTLCLPYLMWRESEFPGAPDEVGLGLAWTYGPMTGAFYNWLPRDRQAGFVIDGGGGTACQVDRARCRSIEKVELATSSPYNIYDNEGYSYRELNRLTNRTLFDHPRSWFLYKSPYVLRSFVRPLTTDYSPRLMDFLWTALTVFGVAGMIFLPIVRRFSFADRVTYAALGWGFLFVFVFPPFLGHVEDRYLLPVRFVGGLVGSFVVIRQIERFAERASNSRSQPKT